MCILPRMDEPPAEFLSHIQNLGSFVLQDLSEADTRVYLIDPVLRILGYITVGDLRREVPVPATREFIDYELYAGGKAQAILEAKAVRFPITDAAAAQCVQYASILGVRWCLVTNGVTWSVYNAHAAGPLHEKRVASVRLDGPEDEIAEAWDVLKLFRRDSLASANPLSRLLAERVIADELANRDSQAVQALRRAVRSRFNERISGEAVVEIVAKLTGRGRSSPATASAAAPVPLAPVAAPNGEAVSTGEPAKARRPLNLKRKPDGSLVRLQDLIQSGHLAVGARLECRIADSWGEGIVVAEGIQVNGQVFENPSKAAHAVRPTSVNGWDYWQCQGRTLSQLRDEYLRSLTPTQ